MKIEVIRPIEAVYVKIKILRLAMKIQQAKTVIPLAIKANTFPYELLTDCYARNTI